MFLNHCCSINCIVKKIYKILLITIASILLLLIIISFLAGPIVKNYVENHSKELCNRTVTIDKLYINIFWGVISIEGLSILEEDDSATFFTFEKLKVNASFSKLLNRKVKLTKISLIQPKASIIQNNSRFNFSDIIDHFSSDEPDTTESKSKWSFDLRNIVLENGNFIYQDAVVNSKIDLREFSLQIPKIAFSTENTNVGIDLKFADGGNLNLKMLLDQENNSYNLKTSITNLKIGILEPYLKNMINISDLDGLLTTNLDIQGNLEHIMELSLHGDLDLNKFNINDKNNKQLSSFNNLHIEIENIDLKEDKYYFKQIQLSDFKFSYDVYSNGSSLSMLTKIDTTSTASESENMDSTNTTQTSSSKSNFDLKVEKCSISNARILYKDFTLGDKNPFTLPISKINVSANGFSLSEQFPLSINAIVGKGGELIASWYGMLSDFSNQSILLTLKNIQLSDFSPYCVHYTAFPISGGLMNFQSINKIVNNDLTSHNNIKIYKCAVDKKLKEVEPEYNIPLKAALYVLTDRKGSINIDLPVSGNIASPKFSFKRLIFKTLGNFLVKVATSPVNFITNAIDNNKSVFTDILMPNDRITLTIEQSDQLNDICAILKEKQNYNLTINTTLDSLDFRTITETNDTIIDPKMAEINNDIQKVLLHHFSTQFIDNKRIIFINDSEHKAKTGQAIISFGIKVDDNFEEN